jgi:15-cis-phytoene synthase
MSTIQAAESPAPMIAAARHGFMKSHFAPAFLFLPAERRRALRTIYGFFRELDDAVDAPTTDPAPYLDAWRAVIRERRAEPVQPWNQEPMARALVDVMTRFDVPAFALTDFIDHGVAVDLAENRFETPMDTERYCYGVAGTVGIACLPIFGVPVEEAKDFAVRLGVAVQWINAIRDVGIDARMNRIYLPKDHLEQFGCSEADIIAGRATPGFHALMRHEAGVARAHYRRARELFPARWARQLRPARIMGQIYADLLEKIERQDFPVFTKRVALNIVEKAASTWRALKSQT